MDRATVPVLLLFASAVLIPEAWGQAAQTATATAVPAPAGTTQTPAAVAQAPTVNASVEEVSLDLLVRDKKRKPVVDLNVNDIIVTDNNTPVTLRGLHLVTGESKSTHLVTLVFDRFSGATAKGAQTVSQKILKALPKSGFTFSVLDLGARLRLIQGFTADRGAIEHAVNLVTDGEEANPGMASAAAEKTLISEAQTGQDANGVHLSVQDRELAKTLVAAIAGSQQIVKDQHTTAPLAGLLSLIRAQKDMTGRKSIIYFTQNMPMDSAAKAMVQTMVGAASRAGVTFYTVDMNALDVGGKHQLDNAILNGGPAYSPAPVDLGQGHMGPAPMQQQGAAPVTSTLGMATDWTRQPSDYTNTQKSPMADLAIGTGGDYIDAQANLKKPLEHLVEDMTTYYQATYTPPITEYDGSFRSISVKPVRKDVSVHSRAGYYALAASAGSGLRPFEVPLLKILSGSQLPSDLKFRASILRLGDLPDGNSNSLIIEAPLSAVELRKDSHTHLYSAHVSIVAEIKDKDGTVIEHFGEDVTRRGALEAIEGENSETITLQRHFITTPGEYTLEAAVLDQFGGTAGAQRIKFEIPPLAATPSVSEMMLVRDVNAYHEDTDAQEPLRYENSVVTPNVSGVVPKDEKTVSLFFLLHPDVKAADPASLTMEVSHDGRPPHRTTLPMRTGTSGSAIPYLATFSANSLTPGAYAVKAIMTQGGKKAEQQLSFTVEGADPASTTLIASGGGHGPDVADADEKLLAPGTGDRANGQLSITVPANPIPPPGPAEAAALIEDARKLAIGYGDSLPNFICVEVTNRSVNPNGTGIWKHKDTIAELLRYHEKEETRLTLEVNGKASTGEREAMKGTLSTGEFGGVLGAVFQPSSKANLDWKETNVLGTGTVQVFDYRVAKENSHFVIGRASDRRTVGFHGQVFIDSATRNIRRITLIADDLPEDFATRSTSMRVDYDYIAINSHDYLMPVSAEVTVKERRKEAQLNSMEFRDYRRYGSSVELHFEQ